MANPKYWEREWTQKLDNSFKTKIEKILGIIPDTVNSIVDVGCGNGVITNELGKKFEVMGVDRSREALSFVRTKKIESSCENIQLPTKSFDMVFSSELLEHLEDELLFQTISEFKRLTKKYILITVPNKENINKKLVQCPECGQIFNKTYHLRSLDIEKIKKYFPEFFILRYFTFGLKVRNYNNFLEKIKHNYSPSHAWIPKIWTNEGGRLSMCPECSTEFEIPFRFHFIAFFCDILNILMSPKKPYQLFVLMEKKNA